MRSNTVNLVLGMVGTAAAMNLPEIAACAAGFATAGWMLTQVFLAIRKEFKK